MGASEWICTYDEVGLLFLRKSLMDIIYLPAEAW